MIKIQKAPKSDNKLKKSAKPGKKVEKKGMNYNNAEKRGKNFMYANLEKSDCYKCDFGDSNFDYASFRGAHFKSSSFNGCSFRWAEFTGANLKNSSMKSARFENTVFNSSKLEGVSFKGAIFKNTIFLNTEMSNIKDLDLDSKEIKVFEDMPQIEISEEFRVAIINAMNNDYIKKSRVLDTRDGGINTLSIMLLLEIYSEQEIIDGLKLLSEKADRDFHTLSYIIKFIESDEREA